MKKSLLILSLTLFISSLCYADVFVIYKNDTKEIITLSEKDDTVLPVGCTQVKLKGSMQELGFDMNPVYYRYDKNKFIKNQAKIDTDEVAQQKQAEISAEQKIINDRIQKDTIEELKKEGQIFKWLDK